MPSSPILGYRCRKIRSLEVKRKLYAHHLSHTACDIDTAGEVTIYLHRIAEHAEKHRGSRQLVKHLYGKYLGNDRSHPVGYDKLLEKAPHDKLCSVGDVLIIQLMLFNELFTHIIKTANGTLHYRREERKEQSQLRRIFLCLVLTPSYIYDITHRHKCIERNT